MHFNIELPINSLSLGQIGFGTLMEIKRLGYNPSIFPLGQVDLNSFDTTEGERDWLKQNIEKSLKTLDKKSPGITLWHLNGSHKTISTKRNVLWTVHELDQLTEEEQSIVKSYDKVFVTSDYSRELFSQYSDVSTCPNFFDSRSFKILDTVNKQKDVINFSLLGKIEKRKRTLEIMVLWAKMFGGKKGYVLNCCIQNHFVDPEIQKRMVFDAFGGQPPPWNINFLPFQVKNCDYNKFLNFCDIDLTGLSGAEGWNLPHFNCLALGKHGVTLNEHGHKTFANGNNSVLVDPSGKEECYDDKFFVKGAPFNQGNIYQWDEIVAAQAIRDSVERFKKDPCNKEGILLQEKFTVEKTVKTLLEEIL